MEIHVYPFGPLQANLYVILFGTEALIIDPCVPYDALNLEGIKVRRIICTHAHYDHIVEADNIRNRTGGVILAYEDECEAIMDASKNGSSAFFSALSVAPPICALRDGDTLTGGDLELETKEDFSIRVIHTPGHTKGSMCLLLTAPDIPGEIGYLFSGDTIFKGTVGRTDLGGSMPDMMRSVKMLSALPDDVIVLPGHGERTTIGHEKRNNPYFTDLGCDDTI